MDTEILTTTLILNGGSSTLEYALTPPQLRNYYHWAAIFFGIDGAIKNYSENVMCTHENGLDSFWFSDVFRKRKVLVEIFLKRVLELKMNLDFFFIFGIKTNTIRLLFVRNWNPSCPELESVGKFLEVNLDFIFSVSEMNYCSYTHD